jgi:hypothetical protein
MVNNNKLWLVIGLELTGKFGHAVCG